MFSSKALILAKLLSSFSVAVDKAEIETIISYQDKDTWWLYAFFHSKYDLFCFFFVLARISGISVTHETGSSILLCKTRSVLVL